MESALNAQLSLTPDNEETLEKNLVLLLCYMEGMPWKICKEIKPKKKKKKRNTEWSSYSY